MRLTRSTLIALVGAFFAFTPASEGMIYLETSDFAKVDVSPTGAFEGGIAFSFTTDSFEYNLGNISLKLFVESSGIYEGTLYSYNNGEPDSPLVSFYAFYDAPLEEGSPVNFLEFMPVDNYVLEANTTYSFVLVDYGLFSSSVEVVPTSSDYFTQPDHPWLLGTSFSNQEGLWTPLTDSTYAGRIEAQQVIPEPSSVMLGLGAIAPLLLMRRIRAKRRAS